jgi:hypothetical protein
MLYSSRGQQTVAELSDCNNFEGFLRVPNLVPRAISRLQNFTRMPRGRGWQVPYEHGKWHLGSQITGTLVSSCSNTAKTVLNLPSSFLRFGNLLVTSECHVPSADIFSSSGLPGLKLNKCKRRKLTTMITV